MDQHTVIRKAYRAVMDNLPDQLAVRLMYFRRFKRWPNLRRPATFTEKVNWRKLNQRDPRFTVLSDKVAAKDAVAKLIGARHIVPTLWVGRTADELPFDELEPPYVVKVSHGNGGHCFVRRGEVIDRERIRRSIELQLNYSYGTLFREWAYLDVPRRVLVEPMILLPDGEIPDDYKFFVYHGRVHFIQVDYARFRKHRRNFYTRAWARLPVTSACPPTQEVPPEPDRLGEMIAIAETIGAEFDFVRVDLYLTCDDVLFGEATFYPAGGMSGFGSARWDATFGEPWHVQSGASPRT
jgi:hypothetical protein